MKVLHLFAHFEISRELGGVMHRLSFTTGSTDTVMSQRLRPVFTQSMGVITTFDDTIVVIFGNRVVCK